MHSAVRLQENQKGKQMARSLRKKHGLTKWEVQWNTSKLNCYATKTSIFIIDSSNPPINQDKTVGSSRIVR